LSEGSGGGPGEFAVSVGSQVAGYRLEQQIGLGGMAVVYRARDSRLDRDVALKVLAPALAQDDSFRQRFIRESRAAAAVDDPHIIPVYEAGEERGVLFIAMRFVRGGDVRSLLDAAGPLSPERATEILSQAASALDAAHARGLVHRDVKPANMLLEASPDADRPDHVYLSDFGLAKGSLASTGLTSTGQFLGTLDYVAPEQVEGHPVDGRTDQYALGCVAFELLTGRPPFPRELGMAVMWAQVSEAPPRLSSRRPGLPLGVDDVVNRALAKAAADRYPTCRDFAADLRRAFRLGAAGPGPAPAYRPPTQLAQPSRPSAPDPSRPPAGSVPDAGRAAASFGPEAGRAARSGPEATRASAPGQPADPGHPVVPDNWFRPPTGGGPAASAGPGSADPPTQGIGLTPRAGTRPGLTSPEARSGPSYSGAGYGAPGDPGVRSGQTAGGATQRRRWWRSPVPLAVIAALAVVAGGGGYVLASHQSSAAPAAAKPRTVPVGPVIPPPGCTTSTAKLTPLPHVNLHTVPVGGKPFAVVPSADGKYFFATTGAGIAVLQNNGSGSTPTFIRTVSIKGAQKGMVLTPDGRYLLAAGDDDVIVISVQQAEQGAANPVTGVLDSPSGSGAAQSAVSPDGKYVFLTLQNTTHMAVFNLAKALSGGFNAGDFVGFVPLGVQPVGIGISPDGKWLYATSFLKAAGPMPAPGTLSVVSLAAAESTPATAVKAVVDAGCSPARVIASPSTVWVTARDSNALLAFSAARLVSDPKHALLAKVQTGLSPIGLTFADGGKRIVLTDTNLNTKPPASGDLAVIDTARALAGKPALLGVVPANGQPRQVTVADNGATLLMTNMVSADVQSLQLSDLP
jgi:serine/threonine protein kinase/DNA-binding beta-propeller fold protein YncE